jgi:hypothetical protein
MKEHEFKVSKILRNRSNGSSLSRKLCNILRWGAWNGLEHWDFYKWMEESVMLP